MIQEGTPVSANNMNHIEEGIYSVTNVTVNNEALIASLSAEVAILKNASLNNLTNNVFFENLENIDDIKLSNGIYDPVAKKIYV